MTLSRLSKQDILNAIDDAIPTAKRVDAGDGTFIEEFDVVIENDIDPDICDDIFENYNKDGFEIDENIGWKEPNGTTINTFTLSRPVKD